MTIFKYPRPGQHGVTVSPNHIVNFATFLTWSRRSTGICPDQHGVVQSIVWRILRHNQFHAYHFPHLRALLPINPPQNFNITLILIVILLYVPSLVAFNLTLLKMGKKCMNMTICVEFVMV